MAAGNLSSVYGNTKYGDIVGYIGVIQKKKLKKSGLQRYLFVERLKTGVLEKNKPKKSLKTKKIGFKREVFHRYSSKKINDKKN